MKREFFEESMAVGKKLFDELTAASAPVLASDCPLAAIQIRQGTGRAVKHPIEIVRDAYGLEDSSETAGGADRPPRPPA